MNTKWIKNVGGLRKVGNAGYADDMRKLTVQLHTGPTCIATIIGHNTSDAEVVVWVHTVRPCQHCRQGETVHLSWGRTGDDDEDRIEQFSDALRLALEIMKAYRNRAEDDE